MVVTKLLVLILYCCKSICLKSLFLKSICFVAMSKLGKLICTITDNLLLLYKKYILKLNHKLLIHRKLIQFEVIVGF